jgi:DNA-binding response OmpR family regulator
VVGYRFSWLDGYRLDKRFRATALKPMKLMAISGYGQEQDRLRAKDAGFDHHLAKPGQRRGSDACYRNRRRDATSENQAVPSSVGPHRSRDETHRDSSQSLVQTSPATICLPGDQSGT